MDQPLMPGRGSSRAEIVPACVLVLAVLLVAGGFLFDLPWGFGGVEIAIVVAPVVLAVVALTVVLRSADASRRDRRRR